ncbi:MAG: nucleolar RNA-binding Nop10p family protein [Nanoarchaeota archaeon]
MKILKCQSCKAYGLTEKCTCAGVRISPRPPKYSPEDKWGKYRRMWKDERDREEKKEGK